MSGRDLSVFFGAHAVDMGALLTGLAISAWPLIAVYSLFSEQSAEGLTAGAVKG
ncbi:hypothetical protein [Trinickia mobilis]|uniref:hypothetical protein n=1 Tax=Trinickia mobilis TaxID=2816356 RepID=UPI001A8C240E|nr:hypothetical protein [Trinickia mobilis]